MADAALARPRVRGLLHPGAGPVVRVVVEGVAGVAVLDTGASLSVIDRSLARELALESPGAAEWAGVSAAAQRSVAALRRARITVVGDRRSYLLDLVEVDGIRRCVPGLDVLALLGWDFLAACTLTCDGPGGAFELVLPPVRRRRR